MIADSIAWPLGKLIERTSVRCKDAAGLGRAKAAFRRSFSRIPPIVATRSRPSA
jgi:hypothetical protein